MAHRTSETAVVGRLTSFTLTIYLWARLAVVELATWALASGRVRLHPRSAAQGLVEWSLAAAVLAFVGIAAWQLAGTAITDAVNRTITNLNRAGA